MADSADLMLVDGTVVTMNSRGDVHARGAVAIRGQEIVAVGPEDVVRGDWDAPDIVSCPSAAILPGLVNAHAHVPMSLLRGLADDLRLDVWLFGYMLPVEREFVSPSFCRWGTLLSCAEMIRSGVTCFADMYYYEGEIASAVAQAGLRAVCAQTVMKWPTPDSESYDEGLEHCRAFIRQWKGHRLVTPAVGPHALESTTPELLMQAGQLAAEEGVPLLIHVAETTVGAEEARALYGMDSTEALQQYGAFKTHVVAAHCVHITAKERELLAQAGAGAIHNPTSNLKLASGVADIVALRQAGIEVGIGTDGQDRKSVV